MAPLELKLLKSDVMNDDVVGADDDDDDSRLVVVVTTESIISTPDEELKSAIAVTISNDGSDSELWFRLRYLSRFRI